MTQYAAIIPNGAERIMQMAEKQLEHRIETEKFIVRGQMSQSNMGQFLAFFIGIAALGAAAYCIIKGHDWAGSILGVGGLTGLVTAFIQGRKHQENDVKERRVKSSAQRE